MSSLLPELQSRLFPHRTSGPDNRVSAELEDQRRSVLAEVKRLPDEQILRPELEAQLADSLTDRFIHPLLELGDAVSEKEVGEATVLEIDPRYLGPSLQPYERKVDVFVVRIPLMSGDRQWLYHRPDGSFQEPSEQLTYDPSRRAIILGTHDDERHDPEGNRAKSFVRDQLALLAQLVAATNRQLVDWNEALPAYCRGVIAAERDRRRQRAERQRGLGLPITTRTDAPIPYPLPRRRARRVRFSPDEVAALRGRPALPAEDFAEVLNELQRAALLLREHPGLWRSNENAMRDLLLCVLNAAFPSGVTGETFSRRGRADIRVVTTSAAASGSGECVFKAECKVWKSPSSATKAVEQLCERYLTWPETRTAIILFAPEPEQVPRVTTDAIERLMVAFSCRRMDDVAGWPVLEVADPPSLDIPIALAVVAM